MEPARKFTDLIVWQRAHQFVLGTYSFTAKEEIYGLTSQLRRAAISIAANIAEGFVRKTKPDKLRFLNISQGSLEECKYYLMLSRDLRFNENQQLDDLLEEVSKILNSYARSINNSR